jgi:hypothetical protein
MTFHSLSSTFSGVKEILDDRLRESPPAGELLKEDHDIIGKSAGKSITFPTVNPCAFIAPVKAMRRERFLWCIMTTSRSAK